MRAPAYAAQDSLSGWWFHSARLHCITNTAATTAWLGTTAEQQSLGKTCCTVCAVCTRVGSISVLLCTLPCLAGRPVIPLRCSCRVPQITPEWALHGITAWLCTRPCLAGHPLIPMCYSCTNHAYHTKMGTAWPHSAVVHAAVSCRASFNPNVGFFEKLNYGSDSIMQSRCASAKDLLCGPHDATWLFYLRDISEWLA
jgi:hypothetical protein